MIYNVPRICLSLFLSSFSHAKQLVDLTFICCLGVLILCLDNPIVKIQMMITDFITFKRLF
jgi:hypothetical protein